MLAVLATSLAGVVLVSCSAEIEPTVAPPTQEQSATPAAAPSVVSKTEDTAEPAVDPGAAGTALAQLATIPIKGRAPKTGYDRDEFGSGWKDPDGNHCDARNDELKRGMSDETYRPGTGDCVVETGTLADPYTATIIHFIKGDKTTLVDIDHVVALSDAWQKGAQQLTSNQREALANDPLNLLAVDGPANRQKGAGDAATWLPSNKSFRCEYVALQTAVKAKYSLWMTQAEHDAVTRVLSSCPDQLAPTDGGIAVPIEAQEAPPTPVATTAPVKEPAEESAVVPAAPSDVVYKNCSAVRDAGAAPIKTGEPGFGSHLDGDGDGIACE